MTIDEATKRWIRNAADERAADNGCRFNEARGRHVLDFAKQFIRLYEGEKAGEVLEPMPWQVEVTMRLFGWEKWSDRWKRWIRRFRQASVWVPKKNGKSPTLSWWGLYLLCADGEQGQKVYFAAKDGTQARDIAGKHAIEMVRASPDLMAECSINLSLMQITHEPTRSLLKPISSGDSRAAKAKEGLNGSVLVDETHVVDREFMNRINRAGISRSEPLLIEVSTAGNDPDGYGKERYDYGKAVERGDDDNEQLLFASYEGPQDLDDADLAADPEKYGREANPAWGFTVDPVEYVADYQQSRRSASLLADFKMYRLDIWQQSANPWLNMADWQRCREKFTEGDLLGRDCYGAFDLARTRDTTSLFLIFPWDEDDGQESYRALAYHWLPRETAEQLAGKVRYLEWAQQGWMTLTPGNTCDYAFVRKALNEAREKFNLLKLGYDGTYAAQMVQRLVEEDGWPDGEHGVPFEFKQNVMSFANPTAAFERLVIDGRLRHNGNPVLTWQAGNVRVKTDVNENMRPVKQKHGDIKTIDGMVAGIMAVGIAQANKDVNDWYRPGILSN
jgi:phage terminase large subunit-like protein